MFFHTVPTQLSVFVRMCIISAMELLKHFLSFTMKDVTNDNETKKASVLMRVYCEIMLLYFTVQVVIFLVGGQYTLVLLPLAGAAGHIILFALTYFGHSKVAREIIIYFTLAWVLAYIFILGWDGGFQHFCFVILALILITGYAKIQVKILGAGIICAIRIALYFYCRVYPPYLEISSTEIEILQTVTTIVIFAQMTFMMLLFSFDSLESEKKLIDYNDKVKEMASVDPLTGLSNRRGMEEYIARQMRDTTENEGFFNFAIGDIDFFKKVNDTYGHAAGDDLLKQLAEIFRQRMKGKGRVARWGGEEFLFLYLGMNGDQADVELEEIRKEIKRTEFRSGDQVIRVTMTFGLEEHNMGDPYEQSISAADEKLYRGKENGRDQVVF